MIEERETITISKGVLNLLRIQSEVILSQAKMLEKRTELPPFSVIKNGKVIKKGKIA